MAPARKNIILLSNLREAGVPGKRRRVAGGIVNFAKYAETTANHAVIGLSLGELNSNMALTYPFQHNTADSHKNMDNMICLLKTEEKSLSLCRLESKTGRLP